MKNITIFLFIILLFIFLLTCTVQSNLLQNEIETPDVPVVTGTPLSNDTTPTWSWNKVNRAEEYRYSFDESNWNITKQLNYTPVSDLSEDSHTLFVQAGNSTGWSKSGNFTITIDTSIPGNPVYNYDDSVVYYESIMVELSGDNGVNIYYSLNQSDDPSESSTLYTNPINLNSDTTVKAISINLAGSFSNVISKTYKFDMDAGNCTISLLSGSYNENQTVTVTPDSNTEVYYTFTTDDSTPDDPTESDTKYTSSFDITANADEEIIYKYKFKGFTTAISRSATESAVVPRTWIIDKKAPTIPVVSGISAGDTSQDQSFTISGDSGTSLEYSLNNGSS